MHLAEAPRQAEEWESFLVSKGGGFSYALIGSCWRGVVVSGLPRRWSILCDWIRVRISLFLVFPNLEEGSEIRESVGYKSGPGYFQLIVTELLFGFLNWLLQIIV